MDPTFDNPYGIPPVGDPAGCAIYLDVRTSYPPAFGVMTQGLLWHILVHLGEAAGCNLKIQFDRPQGHVNNYLTARVYHVSTNPLGGLGGLSYNNSLVVLPNKQAGERVVWATTEGDPLFTAQKIAHEIGHAAGLGHVPGPERNLMLAGGAPTHYETLADQRAQWFYAFGFLKAHQLP